MPLHTKYVGVGFPWEGNVLWCPQFCGIGACLQEATGHNLWDEALVPSHREFTVHGKHQGVSEFAGKRDRYKGKEIHAFRSIGEQESCSLPKDTPPQKDIHTRANKHK